jgi:hypothetical protein
MHAWDLLSPVCNALTAVLQHYSGLATVTLPKLLVCPFLDLCLPAGASAVQLAGATAAAPNPTQTIHVSKS